MRVSTIEQSVIVLTVSILTSFLLSFFVLTQIVELFDSLPICADVYEEISS